MTKLHHLVEGSGPVVVLLHAGVADLRMWDAQVEALATRRTVVCCDLAGYGGTPMSPGADGCDAEDVLALLSDLDADEFALVGASYGGSVALQIASAVPDRVERLVLLNAAADLVEPDESLREVWAQEESLVELGDLDGATDLMVSAWLGPDADEKSRALVRDMQRRAYDLQVTAGDDVTHRELPVRLSQITAPVAVIVGGLDFGFSEPPAAPWPMSSRTPSWSNSPGRGTCRRSSVRPKRLAWWLQRSREPIRARCCRSEADWRRVQR